MVIISTGEGHARLCRALTGTSHSVLKNGQSQQTLPHSLPNSKYGSHERPLGRAARWFFSLGSLLTLVSSFSLSLYGCMVILSILGCIYLFFLDVRQ